MGCTAPVSQGGQKERRAGPPEGERMCVWSRTDRIFCALCRRVNLLARRRESAPETFLWERSGSRRPDCPPQVPSRVKHIISDTPRQRDHLSAADFSVDKGRSCGACQRRYCRSCDLGGSAASATRTTAVASSGRPEVQAVAVAPRQSSPGSGQRAGCESRWFAQRGST